ncbi:hypothetical protein [Nocardia colli]|uniref:hypothetical protein n=1 Tax=Nocardia colli TaxID=2545717 RepID=UPI0035D7DE74
MRLVVVLGLPVAAFVLLMMTLIETTAMFSQGYGDLRDQCRNAIGPDPSETVTTVPGTSSAQISARPLPRVQRSATAPATNPFASLTGPTTGYLGECLSAERVADYRGPLLRDANAGPAVDCAGSLARVAADRSATTRSADVSFDAAGLIRFVIYHASLATGATGCQIPAMTTADVLAVPPSGSAGRRGCARPAEPTGSRSAPVVLPERIADQALCGQPVDRAAISAGDLVFWDFRANLPQRAGVAIDATTVVAVDPTTGGVARVVLEPAIDIGAKRVLEAGGD